VRDIQRAYQDAMVEEYESLVRGGRTAEAKHVARQLKAQFGLTVGADDAPPPPPAPTQERADEPRPVEDTAEPKPAPRRGPGRPRKTTEATPSDKK
jgi:hypothetical protein